MNKKYIYTMIIFSFVLINSWLAISVLTYSLSAPITESSDIFWSITLIFIIISYFVYEHFIINKKIREIFINPIFSAIFVTMNIHFYTVLDLKLFLIIILMSVLYLIYTLFIEYESNDSMRCFLHKYYN